MCRIELELNEMMKKRKISLNELSSKVGITNVNLSKIKNNKINAVRLSTLSAICEVLNCEPGDILKIKEEEDIKC